MDRTRVFIGFGLATGLVLVSIHIGRAQNPTTVGHKAVGSWFGRAVQVCENGVGPAVCVGTGSPAQVLFMTPTLMSDGQFVAADTLTFANNHLTAHGQWKALSSTEFLADYMFVIPRVPGTRTNSVAGLRARWQGRVLDDNTLVGHVNAILATDVPVWWQRLADNEFPGFPEEGLPLVTAPGRFIFRPERCEDPGTPGCPLVFKFTIKRVTY